MPNYAPTPLTPEQQRLIDEVFIPTRPHRTIISVPSQTKEQRTAQSQADQGASRKKRKKQRKRERNKRRKLREAQITPEKRLYDQATISRPFVPWSEIAGEQLNVGVDEGAAIYALVDPDDGRVRYVGATNQSIEDRRDQHVLDPTNSRMRQWIKSLTLANKKPNVYLITYCKKQSRDEVEIGWIANLRARGSLLNVDPGGRYRDQDGEVRQKEAKRIFKQYYRQGAAPPRPQRTKQEKAAIKDKWRRHQLGFTATDQLRLAGLARLEREGRLRGHAAKVYGILKDAARRYAGNAPVRQHETAEGTQPTVGHANETPATSPPMAGHDG